MSNHNGAGKERKERPASEGGPYGEKERKFASMSRDRRRAANEWEKSGPVFSGLLFFDLSEYSITGR